MTTHENGDQTVSENTRRRVARKPHRCPHCRTIQPGEVYLEHTLFPDNDAGYEITAPIRLPECSDCAIRYGREALLAGTR